MSDPFNYGGTIGSPMTDPTMLDFEKLCTWKAERRYPPAHLKQLGIELIRLDIAEYRIH